MFTMWLVAIGTTTLIEAVYWGHTKVVRLLIRKGASVNVETPSGRVPLLEACNRTNMHVAKVGAALTAPRTPGRLTNACCHSSCFKGKQTLTRRMRSGEFCVCVCAVRALNSTQLVCVYLYEPVRPVTRSACVVRRCPSALVPRLRPEPSSARVTSCGSLSSRFGLDRVDRRKYKTRLFRAVGPPSRSQFIT